MYYCIAYDYYCILCSLRVSLRSMIVWGVLLTQLDIIIMHRLHGKTLLLHLLSYGLCVMNELGIPFTPTKPTPLPNQQPRRTPIHSNDIMITRPTTTTKGRHRSNFTGNSAPAQSISPVLSKLSSSPTTTQEPSSSAPKKVLPKK